MHLREIKRNVDKGKIKYIYIQYMVYARNRIKKSFISSLFDQVSCA